MSRPTRVPTILQMEATECGAASLAMVLAAHGRYEPLEMLRVACGVSRDGSRASNIVRAARQYGLDARGWRRDPAEVWAGPLPAIAHWNFNHFLVVEGRDRRRVHLNDPAQGRRIVDDDEFDRAFTGVLLTFEPTAEFRPGGRPFSVGAALRRRLRGVTPALAQTAVAGVLLLVPTLVVAALTRVFVDAVLVADDRSGLSSLALGLAACLAAVVGLTWLQRRALVRVQTKIAAVTTSRFLWHVLRLPPSFFTQRQPGDIAQRALMNQEVAAILAGQLAGAVISGVTVIAYAALMLTYSPVLTLVGVLAMLANVLALRTVLARRRLANDRLLKAQGQLRGSTVNGLQLVETLKASAGEADFFQRWTGEAARSADANAALAPSAAVLQALPPVFAAISTAGVLYLGGRQVIDGGLTLGQLIAFQLLLAGLLAPVQQLTNLGQLLQRTGAVLRRLDDVLQNRPDPALAPVPDPEPASSAKSSVRLRGEVTLREVTFGYSPLAPALLNGLDLTLEPGSRVALVGRSGSGKSTVGRLVAGLEQPWAGAVGFDGLPGRPPRSLLVGSIAYVDQDILLFEGSIRDNLTLWDPTIPEPVLVQAAKDACIHDDIVARPGAYAAPVEDGGRNFSGGQRQRLEIARALVTNPSILVLDEATSALDALVEQEIDRNLRRRGCTCLVVAHRLSTVRDADEIVVLDRGRVAERGSHEQLIAAGGVYARLIATEDAA